MNKPSEKLSLPEFALRGAKEVAEKMTPRGVVVGVLAILAAMAIDNCLDKEVDVEDSSEIVEVDPIFQELTDELVLSNYDYLMEFVYEVTEQLRQSGVKSQAFPDELLVDVITVDVVTKLTLSHFMSLSESGIDMRTNSYWEDAPRGIIELYYVEADKYLAKVASYSEGRMSWYLHNTDAFLMYLLASTVDGSAAVNEAIEDLAGEWRSVLSERGLGALEALNEIEEALVPDLDVPHEGMAVNNLNSPMMMGAVDERIAYFLDKPGLDMDRVYRRSNQDYNGNGPMIDQVERRFRSELQNTELGRYMTDQDREFFTRLCVYGQVAKESAWRMHAHSDADARGIWQIIPAHANGVDLFNDPIGATGRAVWHHNDVFLDVRDRVHNFQTQYNLSSSDFLIPILIQGYISGKAGIIDVMDWFNRHYSPEDVRAQLGSEPYGMDLFRFMIERAYEARNTPEVEGNGYGVDYFGPSSLAYVAGSMAMAEIMLEKAGEPSMFEVEEAVVVQDLPTVDLEPVSFEQVDSNGLELGDAIELDGMPRFTYRGNGSYTSGFPGDDYNGRRVDHRNGEDVSLVEALRAMRDLSEYGVERVVSIETRSRNRARFEHDSFDSIASAAIDANMEHHRLGLFYEGGSSLNIPSQDSKDHFDSVIAVAADCLNQGDCVIHCREGLNRSVNVFAVASYIVNQPEIISNDRQNAVRFDTTPEIVAAYRSIGVEFDSGTVDGVGRGNMWNAESLLSDSRRVGVIRRGLN